MNELQMGVLVGRFCPLHNGHCHIIDTALNKFDKVIVVLGYNNPSERSEKYPFTLHERVGFVEKVYCHNPLYGTRLLTSFIKDVGNWRFWMKELDEVVKETTEAFRYKPVFIIGRYEDSRFYNIGYRKTWVCPTRVHISGTILREMLKNKQNIGHLVRPEIYDDIIKIWKDKIQVESQYQ